MSLDNAALAGRWSNGDPVHIITDGENRTVAPNLNGAEWIPDKYSSMTDRELLEYIARNIDAAVAIASGVQAQFSPMIERLGKHPLLGSLFR